MKVIAYRIRIDGQERVVRTAKELREAIRDTNRALQDTDIGTLQYKKLERELARLRNVQKGLRDDTRKVQRSLKESAEAGTGSYRELQLTLTRLKNEYKDLGRAARESTRGQQLRGQIAGLSSELKTLDRGLGDNFRNVGNYQSALSGVFRNIRSGLAAAGIVASVDQIVQAVGRAVQTFVEFNEEVARTQAISGASSEEIDALEADARRLGETTEFTASQVAELQTQFARGGFRPDEIIAVTEAALDLSTATGEDLSRAAQIVSANVRAFGLESQEAARFADVLTDSLNSSNQELEDYAEAVKFVAPVAKLLGVSVEETSAAIGILADNGLKGSIATRTLGTSLQNLSDDTKKYQKRAQELGVEVFDQQGDFVGLAQLLSNLEAAFEGFNDQQRLAALSQIFGAEATRTWATLLDAQKTVLIDNNEITAQGGEALANFTRQLENAGGAAKETAEIIRDTLAGDIKEFRSALEGLQIFIVSQFEGPLRSAVQGATSIIRRLGSAFEVLRQIFEPLIDAFGRLGQAVFESQGGADAFRLTAEALGRSIVFVVNVVTRIVNELGALIDSFNQARTSGNAFAVLFDTIVIKPIQLFIASLIEVPALLNGLLRAIENFGDSIVKLRFDRIDPAAQFRRGVLEIRNFDTVVKDSAEQAVGVWKEAGKQIDALDPLSPGNLTFFSQDAKNQAKEEAKELGDNLGNELADDLRADLESELAFLRKQIQDLKQAVEETPEGRGLETLISDLVEKERELEALEARVRTIRRAVEGETTVEGLKAEISDIQALINSSPADDNLIDLVQLLVEKEGELEQVEGMIQAIRRALEGGEFNVTEPLAGPELPTTVNSQDDNADLRADLESELAFIEQRRLQALDRLNGLRLENEEEYANRREQINREAVIRATKAELAAAEQGSLQYLALKDRLYQQELELNRNKNQLLTEQEKQFLTQALAQANQLAGIISDSILGAERQRIEQEKDARLSAVEEEFDRRLELAEEGSLEEQRLQKELAEARLQIERQAANEQREIALKQNTINTALAVTNALATVRPFLPAGLIAAGIALARGLAEGQRIRSQSFAGGGFTGWGKKGADRTGERPVDATVHEKEYVVPRKVAMSKRGRSLIAQLEAMRRSMGFTTNPWPFKSFAEGGVVGAAIVPSELQGGTTVVNARVELSDEDIDRIGLAVAEGSAIGSKQGTEAGAKEAAKEETRRKALREKTLI